MGAGTPRLEELGARDQCPEGHTRGDPLGGEDDVRANPPVIDRPHPSGAPRPGLDLVGDEQDPVAIADLAKALEEAVLRDDVAALALDRLHDDRRDLTGGHELVEEDLVEPAQVRHVPERGVIDARQQRAEAFVVLRLRGSERDRPVGPAVEPA